MVPNGCQNDHNWGSKYNSQIISSHLQFRITLKCTGMIPDNYILRIVIKLSEIFFDNSIFMSELSQIARFNFLIITFQKWYLIIKKCPWIIQKSTHFLTTILRSWNNYNEMILGHSKLKEKIPRICLKKSHNLILNRIDWLILLLITSYN